MLHKFNLSLAVFFMAAVLSAIVPQESFDVWVQNHKKTKFWKNQNTVPANWTLHDRKDRKNNLKKTRDGLLLNGMIESKLSPVKNRETYEIKVRARGKKGSLKVYFWQYQTSLKHLVASGWVLDVKTTGEYQEYTGVVSTIIWWPVQLASIALDGENVEIADIKIKKLENQKAKKAPETIITIPRLSKVSIDGKFDPVYWEKNGIVIKNGLKSLGSAENSSRQSVVSFLADKTHFYVAVDEIATPDQLKAKVFQRDGSVYLDESIELALISDAAKLKELIYHVCVNFNGTIFDRVVDQIIGQFYINFNSPGLTPLRKSYKKNGENHEVLILKVPYSTFKINDPSKPFGMNVSRNYQNPSSNVNLGGVPYLVPGTMTKFRVLPAAPALTWEVDELSRAGRYLFRLAGKSHGGFKGEIQIRDAKGNVLKSKKLSGNSSGNIEFDNRKNIIHHGSFEAEAKAEDGTVLFKYMMSLNTDKYKIKKEKIVSTEYRNALKVEHYPFQKKINIRWMGMSFKEMREVKKVKLEITNPIGQVIRLERSGMDFYDGHGYGVFPFTAKPYGKYTVNAQALDANGKIMVIGNGTFETKELSWVGNKYGCEKVILPPYTPMKVSGNTVSCLIRDHKFGQNGLLASMIADKGEVLEHPIDFIVETENGILKRKSAEFKFTKKDKDRVEFTAINRYPDLDIVLDGWMEYDGFLWYTMKLIPGKKGIKLKKLSLNIPYKDAKLFHYLGESIRHDKNFFELDAELPTKGRIWDSRQPSRTRLRTTFLTQVWLGSNARGLCWFAENDKGWSVKKRSRSFEVFRDDSNKISLKVNFVAVKTTLKTPSEIKFGLLATPLAPEKTGNEVSLDWSTTFGMGIANIGLEVPDTYIADRIINHTIKTARIMYTAGQEYASGDSELKYFKDEVLSFPYHKYGGGSMQYKCKGPDPENYYIICYDWTPEMVDFYAWRMHYLMKNTAVSGIYVDNSYPYHSMNIQTKSNLAYVRNGDQIQPGTSILLFRQLMKRIATLNYLMKKPYPGIVVHNTGAHYLPRFTFVQAAYGGEMDIPKKGDHFDIFYSAKPEILLGVNWGIRKGMLTMLGPHPKQKAATRAMYACYKIYDCALWNNGMYAQIHRHLKNLEISFGTGKSDCKFVLWRNNRFVKVTNGAKSIRCSYYERPGKKLFYMANHDKNMQKVSFTLGAAGTLTDGESGKIIPAVNGIYTIDIGKHDFRCLVWKKK